MVQENSNIISMITQKTNSSLNDTASICFTKLHGGKGGKYFTGKAAYRLGGPLTGLIMWTGDFGYNIGLSYIE